MALCSNVHNPEGHYVNIKDCWLTIPWLCSLATPLQEQTHTYTYMRILMEYFFSFSLMHYWQQCLGSLLAKIHITILVMLNSRLCPWSKKLDRSTGSLHNEANLKMFSFFHSALHDAFPLLFLCEIINKGWGKRLALVCTNPQKYCWC